MLFEQLYYGQFLLTEKHQRSTSRLENTYDSIRAVSSHTNHAITEISVPATRKATKYFNTYIL